MLLGHVTRDEIAGGARIGGAVSYAAMAASRLGVETAVVTVAPPDEPLLDTLRALPNVTVHVAPDDTTTTFALAYSGPQRTLTLVRRARPLAPQDLPPQVRGATVAYVGPVAGECDRALLRALDAPFVGVGLQGWMRRFGAHGEVIAALSREIQEPPALGAAILSEQDHAEADAVAARFARAGAVVALTRAARGATLILPAGASDHRIEIPATPAREVDPTGAGDVFGVLLTLRLAAGDAPEVAGRAAAAAAARAVEGPGVGTL